MQIGFAATPLGRLRHATMGTGPAFVLLPGTGQAHALFGRQIAALAARLRVVAIDLPGSPGSAPVPDPVSVASLAEGVAAAMDALGIARAHVYGIHLGNKVGAALAARRPERVETFVFGGQSHSIMPDNAARSDYVRKIARHHFADAAGNAAGDPARAELRRLYEANFAYDLERDLRRLACPTLIVEIATPAEDAAPGRQGARLLDIVPRSTLATFEVADGLGHTLDDRADDLARAIFAFVG